MQNKYALSKIRSLDITVLTAGMAGGMVEIFWVTMYSNLSSVSATNVAREISATLLPFTANSYYAPMLGILFHLMLSLLLAISFNAIILKPVVRQFGNRSIILCCFTTLAIVWAVNFFIVLPIINPSFISLMPYVVTLISKLLFGLAMAWVLMKMGSFKRTVLSN